MVNISKDFVLSGKAIFTVSNGKGEQYTYQVEETENKTQRPTLYFARVLSTKEKPPIYLGVINKDGTIKFTKASKFSDTSKEYLVLAWALKQVWEQRSLPTGYSIQHA